MYKKTYSKEFLTLKLEDQKKEKYYYQRALVKISNLEKAIAEATFVIIKSESKQH